MTQDYDGKIVHYDGWTYEIKDNVLYVHSPNGFINEQYEFDRIDEYANAILFVDADNNIVYDMAKEDIKSGWDD